MFRRRFAVAVGASLALGCSAPPLTNNATHEAPSQPIQVSKVPASPATGKSIPVERASDPVVATGSIRCVDHETPVLPSDGHVVERPLSLEDFMALALRNNPAIKQASAAAAKAEGVRAQVGLRPNPTFGYSGQQLADEGTDQHLGFVSQQLVTADKLERNRHVLSHDVNAQRWEVQVQRVRVQTDVRLRFYEALAAQRRLELSRDFHQVAAKGVDVARQRLEILEAAKPDVLQAEIQLSEVELMTQQAEVSFQAAWNRLTAVAGVPYLPAAPLDGSLSLEESRIDGEHLYQQLLASSPELMAARARLDRARANIGRQEVQAIPNLTAQVAAGHDRGTGSGMVNVELSVPLPVHNRNQGNLSAAHAEYCRASQDVHRLELLLRDRLAEVLGEYGVARAAVERYETSILPKAEESLALSEQAYQAQEFDFLRVLTARRAFFETNLQYVEQLAALAQADGKLEGWLLSEGLANSTDFSGDDGLRDQALGGE